MATTSPLQRMVRHGAMLQYCSCMCLRLHIQLHPYLAQAGTLCAGCIVSHMCTMMHTGYKLTLEAATTPVGCSVITSLAKEGPDMKTHGCLRPNTSTTSSDIILPVPTSRPLLTEMIGTSCGNMSCNWPKTQFVAAARHQPAYAMMCTDWLMR